MLLHITIVWFLYYKLIFTMYLCKLELIYKFTELLTILYNHTHTPIKRTPFEFFYFSLFFLILPYYYLLLFYYYLYIFSNFSNNEENCF